MSARSEPAVGADSFESLLARVHDLKDLLAAETRTPVVAVGHGIFLRFFFADCLLAERFTPALTERLWQLGSFNGAISTFERVEGDPLSVPVEDPWRCVTWMERPPGL